ncbi:XkdX family protein [Sporosarcina limicola]|uniref:XkdX family phage protein n=1 Tax=Sporosarcina limicola TaxID=34101 RepID=A0A927MP70_9BACL|nr:XkdX family protein [Sporosarcina limicola]MBE1554816.1 putative XkdX family phage protein [Sporosarcina limicola]
MFDSLFESLKYRYHKNWCRKDQLARFVKLGAITPEEYKEIANEAYSAE